MGLGGRYAFLPIPEELLSEIDGDILFLITEDLMNRQNLNLELQKLKVCPLWSKLKVVRHSSVHEVGFYWRGMSPILANLVIDDLC
ncbi:MAG: hypothetical protein PUP92_20705 [Rhizonema sp. PD38]|nr:hypothetical protein [Rhizonema sp. PD38]